MQVKDSPKPNRLPADHQVAGVTSLLSTLTSYGDVPAMNMFKRNGYSTVLGKPKKEIRDKPKGVNSAAVQAFLKKKEEEEKQKLAEAKKKKAELMKARAEQNTLSKMNNMIKRNHTKEAIFEVEGNEAAKQNKFSSGSAEKEDVTFTRLKSETGGKVRRALITNVKRAPINPNYVPKEEKEKSEQQGDGDSHSNEKHTAASKSSSTENRKHSKERRKSSGDTQRTGDSHRNKSSDGKTTVGGGGSTNDSNSKPKMKKKKRPAAPPPMSFNELLKIAEKKKEGPAAEVEPKKKKSKKDPTMSRPLTQEEKDRLERVRSKEYQYWLKTGRRPPNSTVGQAKQDLNSKGNQPTASTSSGSDKASGDRGPSKDKGTLRQNSNSPSLGTSTNGKVSAENCDKMRPTKSAFSKKLKIPAGKKLVEEAASKDTCSKPSSSQKPSGPSSSSQKNARSSQRPQPSQKPGGSQSARSSSGPSAPGTTYDETNENLLVCRPTKEKEQSTWDRIYGSVQKKHRKPDISRGKRVIESDDEEEDDDLDDFIEDDDDDMDDFIDDSEAPDYSKYIQQIFGYDKRKYRDYDDDDCGDMEASYAQIEREEKISAKIGLQEDLEDIRREEEELRRKALMKKKNKKLKSR